MKRLLLAGNILSFSVGKKISTQEIAACLKTDASYTCGYHWLLSTIINELTFFKYTLKEMWHYGEVK